jgi:hypothetical protein
METNPYQSPEVAAFQPQAPGALQVGMLNQVRVVSILMIVQGSLCLLMGGLLLIGSIVLGPVLQADLRRQAPGAGPKPPFDPAYAPLIVVAIYGTMGLAGVIPGGLLIYAGIRNYAFRGWTLGVTALSLGLASMVTCYCLPTSIALAIYGLIVYMNASVKRGFELVAEGWSPEQVVAAAYQQMPLGPPNKPG